MRYAIYVKWISDGIKDSYNVDGKQELMANLEYVRRTNVQIVTGVSKTYSSGEYVPMKKFW